MDASTHTISAKAGGLGDVACSLVNTLFDQGADIHVAMPCYRRIFGAEELPLKHRSRRLHLCQDRGFLYRDRVYTGDSDEDVRGALAFQREVIQNVIPRVRPDLIHCHDWTTGLIPGAAKKLGIPTVFTVHNVHGGQATLHWMEDVGIDAAAFWEHLYYERQPWEYHETRGSNPAELLTSGIFAADFVNTVSPGFLREMTTHAHSSFDHVACHEIGCKAAAGRAVGILNAPDDRLEPATDASLAKNYDARSVLAGKAANKNALRQRVGLHDHADVRSALFFWPSRLDPVQKGCQLLEELLPWIQWHNSNRQGLRIQIAIVADGPGSASLTRGAQEAIASGDVSVQGYDDSLSRLGYAGSDFTLVPSSYEPCGLPQMVSQKYGSLPVVFRTGGLADTVRHLDTQEETGNGFSFEHHDAYGLQWAMSEALRFHALPDLDKARHLGRIMTEAKANFSQSRMVDQYAAIYESLLGRTCFPIHGTGGRGSSLEREA